MGSHASRDARIVLDAVRRIVRLLRQSAREAERRTGLSAAQLFVLQQLRAAGGALTPGDLAESTLTHQSSVSGVVKRLVEAGLVSRAASARNRRRVELALTPAGREAARRAPELAQERIISAVDELPLAHRSALASGLSSLVGRLGISGAAPPMFFEEHRGSRAQ
jgi:MarR family transcriptional regulator, lower aerobic nicotinate degradation pathway regulator